MNVTITGGLGFLGRLLARHLASDGHRVQLFDVPGPPAEPGFTVHRGEVTEPAVVGAALPTDTDAVVHLASMVSAECEADPDRAFYVNVVGTRTVLDACRALPVPPRVLYTSSVAVFGALPPGAVVGDGTKQSPASTYGMTKATGELWVNEWTRRGWIDGRTARLPTVIVRPGRPNAAASSFASGVFREPLAGLPAVVPVAEDTPLVLIGHRAAVAGMAGLLAADGGDLGPDRAVGLPGLEVTVAEMLAVARRRAGPAAEIDIRPDPVITAVVGSWPGRWDAGRALSLGLPADASLDQIVDDYLADFAEA